MANNTDLGLSPLTHLPILDDSPPPAALEQEGITAYTDRGGQIEFQEKKMSPLLTMRINVAAKGETIINVARIKIYRGNKPQTNRKTRWPI